MILSLIHIQMCIRDRIKKEKEKKDELKKKKEYIKTKEFIEKTATEKFGLLYPGAVSYTHLTV